MTRQRRYQLRKIKLGLCAYCGDEPLTNGESGIRCFLKRRLQKRKYARRVSGSRPWKRGKPGRPPTEAA